MTPKPRPGKTPGKTPAKTSGRTSAKTTAGTPTKAPRATSGATSSSARQRREAQRAEVLRLEQRRRTRLRVGVPIALVVVVVLGLIVVKLATGGNTPKSGTAAQPGASSVVSAVTNIPLVALNQIGTGTVVTPPKSVTGQTPLTADGKPRVLYVGAEYCPYCAAERWPVIAALARFGTFANLGQTTSSPSDVYPSTATLSFHGATYTSTYLSFTGVETKSNQVVKNDYAPLDTLSAADTTLFDKYDAAPYTSADGKGGIPFVDFGNRYFVFGASYDPAVLKGKTHEQIAAALSDPTTAIAKAVGGTTNVLTAVLCQLTGDKPATVCTASAVVAAKSKLS